MEVSAESYLNIAVCFQHVLQPLLITTLVAVAMMFAGPDLVRPGGAEVLPARAGAAPWPQCGR